MRFVLPLPPSVNNLFDSFVEAGKIKHVKSKRYRAWRKNAMETIVAQRGPQSMPAPPYRLEVWLYFADASRRRDASNFVKAPEDALAAVLHFDDNDVTDPAPHKRLDPEHPRCVVYLTTSNLEGEHGKPDSSGRHLPHRKRADHLPAGP